MFIIPLTCDRQGPMDKVMNKISILKDFMLYW